MKEKFFCNQVAYFIKEHGEYKLRVPLSRKNESKVLQKWEEAVKKLLLQNTFLLQHKIALQYLLQKTSLRPRNIETENLAKIKINNRDRNQADGYELKTLLFSP